MSCNPPLWKVALAGERSHHRTIHRELDSVVEELRPGRAVAVIAQERAGRPAGADVAERARDPGQGVAGLGGMYRQRAKASGLVLWTGNSMT